MSVDRCYVRHGSRPEFTIVSQSRSVAAAHVAGSRSCSKIRRTAVRTDVCLNSGTITPEGTSMKRMQSSGDQLALGPLLRTTPEIAAFVSAAVLEGGSLAERRPGEPADWSRDSTLWLFRKEWHVSNPSKDVELSSIGRRI
jgi:hypothetical protein